MMTDESTKVSLALVAGGGAARQRFERLVRPHYEALYRVAFRFTGSRADAEDLVQETCIRAYRYIDRLSGFEDPRSWLLCVLRRLFIDQTRRYDRRHSSSLDAVGEGEFGSEEPGPAQALESEMTARRIERSWRKLGKEHRSLLALHDVEGYSLAELERITGLKIGTIKSRLHRARVKLGRMLEADGALDESKQEGDSEAGP